MNAQYVWVAIVIVGVVGGIEIGYAISMNTHPYEMHHHFFGHKWNHGFGYWHSGYMMNDQYSRQQMYSSMFGNSQYRQEMSEYLAQNPHVMQEWYNTTINNPQHLQLMQKMMGNLSSIGGTGNMMHK